MNPYIPFGVTPEGIFLFYGIGGFHSLYGKGRVAMKNIAERPDWKRIGLGTGVGVVGVISITGLGAWLMERELIGLEWVDYLAALALLASSFAGAKMTGAGRGRWLNPVLAGAGLWVVLAMIHLGCYEGMLAGAGPVALVILGGVGAAVLLGGGNRIRKSGRRKYRNR